MTEAAAGRPAEPEVWRIDELAQRAGVPVDTIRFYQREGLLPPTRRTGRVTRYGAPHLVRLRQIRDLQSRHFNLGAIRALIADGRLGVLSAVFADDSPRYRVDDLVGATGIDAALIEELTDMGFLGDAAGQSAPRYDNADMQILEAVRGLLDAGLPRQVVAFQAELCLSHMEQMHHAVMDVFDGTGSVAWTGRSREEFDLRSPAVVETLVSLTERLLQYTHRRSLQQVTFDRFTKIDASEGAKGATTDGDVTDLVM